MKKKALHEKLIALGAERLAEVLVELADHSSEAREYVERLVAVPEDRLRKAKSALAGLARERRFYSYAESGTMARNIETILADIEAAHPAPKDGLRLVVRFFESDGSVFERCDDSGGGVGMVYTYSACKLFAQYATACADPAWISGLVLDLYGKDDYGVRGALVDAASTFLSADAVRSLAEACWERARSGETGEDRNSRHWLLAVRSLARQLSDGPLFEKALRAAHPDFHAGAELELAKVYLEAGDAAIALTRLGKKSEVDSFRQGERDRLLLAIHRKLGDRAGEEETAWRLFRSERSVKALEDVLSVIGQEQREQVVQEETRQILAEEHFSSASATFLIELGLVDEAEIYLLRRAGQLNGDSYYYLLSLAAAMESHGRPLAATVVYRTLLESILRRAQYKAYHHGADYLRNLDALADMIEDWQSIQPHASYTEALVKVHGRKKGFWSQYRAGGESAAK